MHKDAIDPSEYLPNTEHVSWIWRATKPKHKIGKQKITYGLEEVETDRTASLLSTKNREKLLVEIQDKLFSERWKEAAAELHTQEVKKRYASTNARNAEIQLANERAEWKHKKNTEFHRKEQAMKNCRLYPISLSKYLENGGSTEFNILALDCKKDGSNMLLLVEDNTQQLIYSTAALKRIVLAVGDNFKKRPNGRILYGTLRVRLLESKTFVNFMGKSVTYYPVEVVEQDMGIDFQDVYNQNESHWKTEEEAQNKMVEVEFPKKFTRAYDFPEGEYKSHKFASRMYRNKMQTVLFFGETPVFGHFLQEELDKIHIYEVCSPILCKFGKPKVTPNKNKDRAATIVSLLETDL